MISSPGKYKVVDLHKLLEIITIDTNSYIPLYLQIASAIRCAITKGDLKPGELIPSEQEIAKAIGVAKMTVRQALVELKRGGFVRRYRGVGTFIAFPRFEHRLGELISFSEDIRMRGMVPSSKIIFFGHVPCEDTIAAHLKLPAGTPVLRIYRLRLADEQPVGIHDAYLPSHVSVSRDELEQKGSLYAVLEEKGLKLVEAKETIEAIAANTEQAKFLGTHPGGPLLKVVRIVFSENHQPIEYVEAVYRSDLYRYSAHLKRGGYGEGGTDADR